MRNVIGLLILIVVFGSGWIIYGWNRLQGRDLNQAPQFDLSEYDRYSEKFKIEEIKAESKQSEESVPPEETKISLESGVIYFKSSFRMPTAAETERLIKDLLAEYPELKNLTLENLEAKKIVDIELPIKNREKILGLIEKDKLVESLTAKEAPVWEVAIKELKYLGEWETFMQEFGDVKVVSKFSGNMDYIAKMYLPEERAALETTLQRLKQNYGDVLEIK